MTAEQKNYILSRLKHILDELPEKEAPKDISENPREMLTITECTQVIKGLSAHTLRILVKRKDIPSIRTGEGKSGKILVPKNALIEYFDRIKA